MKLKLLTLTTAIAALSFATPARSENIQHTNQLLSTGQCVQCDLSDAGLVMVNLVGADLRGADLSRANLSRANLTGANLMGANLSGTSLNGANLTGAVLVGANLTGTDLRGAYLVNANLLGTSLNSAYIQGTYGIPDYAGSPENFHAWGAIEARRGNYTAAIDHYNKALSIDPGYAPAYLGRGLALFRVGNDVGAMRDAEVASKLFETQRNPSGYQVSQQFIAAIEAYRNPPDSGGGGGFGNFIGSLGSLLLQFLL